MTTSPRPLRIGNVSASRTDRSSATAEFLAAASLDVLALDMLSDEAMLDLAEQRAAGGPGYERAALVQIGECLDRLGAGRHGDAVPRQPGGELVRHEPERHAGEPVERRRLPAQ